MVLGTDSCVLHNLSPPTTLSCGHLVSIGRRGTRGLGRGGGWGREAAGTNGFFLSMVRYRQSAYAHMRAFICGLERGGRREEGMGEEE